MTNTVTTNYPHIKINVGPVVASGSGTPGASAYDIWLAAGNTGTEQDFLDSLQASGGTGGVTLPITADDVTPTAAKLWMTPADQTAIVNVAANTNRITDHDERWNSLFDATEEAWNPASSYSAGAIVMHNGQFWIADRDPSNNSEPGVDYEWSPVTIESLYKEIVALRADMNEAVVYGNVGEWRVAATGARGDHELSLDATLAALVNGANADGVIDVASFNLGGYDRSRSLSDGSVFLTITGPHGYYVGNGVSARRRLDDVELTGHWTLTGPPFVAGDLVHITVDPV